MVVGIIPSGRQFGLCSFLSFLASEHDFLGLLSQCLGHTYINEILSIHIHKFLLYRYQPTQLVPPQRHEIFNQASKHIHGLRLHSLHIFSIRINSLLSWQLPTGQMIDFPSFHLSLFQISRPFPRLNQLKTHCFRGLLKLLRQKEWQEQLLSLHINGKFDMLRYNCPRKVKTRVIPASNSRKQTEV